MPRPKSTIKQIIVDTALKSHNCQHNKNHRIAKGRKRLKIKKNRSFECYCSECGKMILDNDIKRLNEISKQLFHEI